MIATPAPWNPSNNTLLPIALTSPAMLLLNKFSKTNQPIASDRLDGDELTAVSCLHSAALYSQSQSYSAITGLVFVLGKTESSTSRRWKGTVRIAAYEESQKKKFSTRMNAIVMLSFCLLILSLPTGCRSISSTPISRFDNNSLAGNSNGEPRWFCNARPHKGVPVKLKVTTHCDVFIKERYCVELQDANATTTTSATNKKPRLQLEEPLAASPLTFVESIPVQTDQVVLVDFKRPGSGSLNLDATFTEDQYFKKITSKLQDDTITDSAALIKNIAKFAGTPVAANSKGAEPESANRKWLERTIAYQRFDINDPLYEIKLEDFVNTHLHACSNPSCSAAQCITP